MVELLHEAGGGGIGDVPEGDQHLRRAGVHKRPGEADHPLTAHDLPQAGLAGGEHHQLRMEPQVEDLAHLQKTVFPMVVVEGHHQPGIGRFALVDQPVGGKVHVAVIAQCRVILDILLAGFAAGKNPGLVFSKALGNSLHLGAGVGQAVDLAAEAAQVRRAGDVAQHQLIRDGAAHLIISIRALCCMIIAEDRIAITQKHSRRRFGFPRLAQAQQHCRRRSVTQGFILDQVGEVVIKIRSKGELLLHLLGNQYVKRQVVEDAVGGNHQLVPRPDERFGRFDQHAVKLVGATGEHLEGELPRMQQHAAEKGHRFIDLPARRQCIDPEIIGGDGKEIGTAVPQHIAQEGGLIVQEVGLHRFHPGRLGIF